MMSGERTNPNEEQRAQSVIVQREMIELTDRLTHEGIDARVILACLTSATANLVTTHYGERAVPGWFDRQAQIVRSMTAGA